MIFTRICFVFALCIVLSGNTHAQMASDQPVVFSQTMIAIVPGSTVPKAISQPPELQTPPEAASESKAEQGDAGALEDVKATLAQQPIMPKIKLRVKVRPGQIPLDSGIFHNYILDTQHGVLTYFPDAYPREIMAENIQKPLDILFIRDDGVVGQIIPEVVPAYLSENIAVKFPLRALLYIQAGLAEQWGIQPGYRIEHGMFKAKPLVYTAPEEETGME